MKPAFLKKFFCLAVFSALLSGLSAEALALDPACNNSGPGGGVWGIMQHQTNAMRARDKSYSAVIREPDTSVGNTCMDKAVALSSRLGAIFSDTPPNKILPPNANVWREQTAGDDNHWVPEGSGDHKLYNPYAGLGMFPDASGNPIAHTLGVALGGFMANTISNYTGGAGGVNYPAPYDQQTPATGSYLARDDTDGDLVTSTNTPTGNFGGSIGSSFGGTGTAALANITGKIITSLTGGGGSFQSLINSTLNQLSPSSILNDLQAGLNTVLNQLSGFLTSLFDGPSPVDVLRQGVGELYTAVGSATTAKKTVYDAIVQNAGNFTAALKGGAEASAEATMSGAGTGNDPAPGCDHIASAWQGSTDPQALLAGTRGIEGGGPTPGMVYCSYSDVVNGACTGMGVEMDTQLDNADNEQPLEDVREDMTKRLRAPKPAADPDGLTSWKQPPQNLPDDDVLAPSDLITEMTAGCTPGTDC